MDLKDHWDQIFNQKDGDKLGWFEKDFSQTEKFLNKIQGWQNTMRFIPGIGTSGVVDLFFNTNVSLIFNDISSEAIQKMRNRYLEIENKIQWICQDISDELPLEDKSIDIWLDRAVLQFLLDRQAIEGYFKNVRRIIKPGGHAIFAEFSKSGVTRCAGLNVKRYDDQSFFKRLPDFNLV